MSSITKYRSACMMAALSAILTAGCSDNLSQPARLKQAGSLHVTGAAAAALGADNRFNLGKPASLNGDGVITSAQASRLALAFLRTYGANYKAMWEADRGRTIDLGRLAVDPRVYFAQSPYGSVPRKDVHPAHRRHLGPYYLVTLVQGTEPVIEIAVSALLTDYGVDRTGMLKPSRDMGMDFIHEGIPATGDYGLMSPEAAVDSVVQVTGAVVTSVPELVLPGGDSSPLLARWKIDVDRDVAAKPRDGTPASVSRTVFVGPIGHARFAVASSGGPATQQFTMIRRGGDGKWSPVSVDMPHHPDRAVGLSVVDLSKGGN